MFWMGGWQRENELVDSHFPPKNLFQKINKIALSFYKPQALEMRRGLGKYGTREEIRVKDGAARRESRLRKTTGEMAAVGALEIA